MDVIKNLFNDRVGVEGQATSYVDKMGNRQVLPPKINDTINAVAVSGQLTNRFDDVTYYTA